MKVWEIFFCFVYFAIFSESWDRFQFTAHSGSQPVPVHIPFPFTIGSGSHRFWFMSVSVDNQFGSNCPVSNRFWWFTTRCFLGQYEDHDCAYMLKDWYPEIEVDRFDVYALTKDSIMCLCVSIAEKE